MLVARGELSGFTRPINEFVGVSMAGWLADGLGCVVWLAGLAGWLACWVVWPTALLAGLAGPFACRFGCLVWLAGLLVGFAAWFAG